MHHLPPSKGNGARHKIVKGGRLEPTPVIGENGTIDLKFQAAHDSKNAYLRFHWKTLNPYPGSEHQYLRFDGNEWKIYGYPKLDEVVQDGAQPGIYVNRQAPQGERRLQRGLRRA